MGNGSTSGSSPAYKDMVGREARQESWFGVRGHNRKDWYHQNCVLVNLETLVEWIRIEKDCRKTKCKVIIMSRIEVVRSWILVKIRIDIGDTTEFELIEQRNSTTRKLSVDNFIWQMLSLFYGQQSPLNT